MYRKSITRQFRSNEQFSQVSCVSKIPIFINMGEMKPQILNFKYFMFCHTIYFAYLNLNIYLHLCDINFDKVVSQNREWIKLFILIIKIYYFALFRLLSIKNEYNI